MPEFRKSTTRNCIQCNKIFHPALSEVKRGNGRFCSISCSWKYINIHYIKSRPITYEISICQFCHKKFKHQLSKGVGKFCSLVCKDHSVRGQQPGHLNQNIRRKIKYAAFDKYGEQCEVCGYILAVDVHHLVPKSEGGLNDISNLAVLCPNHHREFHIGILSKEYISRLRKISVEVPAVSRVQNNHI